MNELPFNVKNATILHHLLTVHQTTEFIAS